MGAYRGHNIHGIMGTENYVAGEANMEFDRICLPIGTLGSLLINFGTNMDVRPLAEVACRGLTVLYEEQGYGVQRDFTLT